MFHAGFVRLRCLHQERFLLRRHRNDEICLVLGILRPFFPFDRTARHWLPPQIAPTQIAMTPRRRRESHCGKQTTEKGESAACRYRHRTGPRMRATVGNYTAGAWERPGFCPEKYEIVTLYPCRSSTLILLGSRPSDRSFPFAWRTSGASRSRPSKGCAAPSAATKTTWAQLHCKFLYWYQMDHCTACRIVFVNNMYFPFVLL
jgi:hypothetical protein